MKAQKTERQIIIYIKCQCNKIGCRKEPMDRRWKSLFTGVRKLTSASTQTIHSVV